MKAYQVKYESQKEIARRFRVTEQLVSDLVCESKKRPEKLRDAKERLKLENRQKDAINAAV